MLVTSCILTLPARQLAQQAGVYVMQARASGQFAAPFGSVFWHLDELGGGREVAAICAPRVSGTPNWSNC